MFFSNTRSFNRHSLGRFFLVLALLTALGAYLWWEPYARAAISSAWSAPVGSFPKASTAGVPRSNTAALAVINVSSTGATSTTPTATDNDYTRINNAVLAAANGDTIMLTGTFNWTEPFAAASWVKGSDGTAATIDDYSIYPPANLNNITFTAASLGAATIQGPGDVPTVDLEAVFYFDGGDNQGWTISNIRFLDFDNAIGMYSGAGGSDAFNGTKIQNNYIRMATDLDSSVAPGDSFQNIAIHLSFGMNQMISGNTIEIPGNGAGADAADIALQSNTSGGNVYDGLQITNNIIRVLQAQSATPEFILGIWENSHGHLSNITVSGNQFLNLAGGNNPALNLQRGFRITSHSSATTTVKYQDNTVQGANIGFQWRFGPFTGNQPVQLISNTIIGNNTGVNVAEEGVALLKFNRIVGNLAAGVTGNTSAQIMAENNWWGCNFGPGVGGAGCSGTVNSASNTGSGGIDFTPWLVLGFTAAPTTVPVGGTSNLAANIKFNSDNVDTTAMAMGTVPNSTPVSFAGVLGTVAPSSTTLTAAMAMAVFTATTAGAGSASTTVDGQTLSANITVNKADTTTMITNDTPDPSVVGQNYTVTATVAVTAPGSGTPTGTVTVSDGTNTCTITLPATMCMLPSTAPGTKTLMATYNSDANFNASPASAGVPHTVNQAGTTTTITADTPDPSVIGQAVPIAYTVVANAPGSGTPTGNVTVTASTGETCAATVAAGSCNITFNTLGARTLTAAYAGDANFTASTSVAENHTVNKANTTTTITADTPDPSVVGQNYTVTAAVAVTAPGSGTPTGTITVSDGTNTCTITLPATSCTLPSTSAGAKTLTATYNGDANFNASPASAGAPHTVNKANTTATITADTPDPSVVGQNYTVTAAVAVTAPGSGTPTGTITVTDGTNNCTITLPATSCVLPSTSAGAKTLTATYNGDANFNASPASAGAPHTVNKADTTTTITADTPDPSVVGQNYTVTATVAVTAPGVGTPTGTITVSDGTNTCTITLPATSCVLPSTSAGAKTLTATYNGDANFNASPASAGAPHTVNKADTTTVITADNPDPSVISQVVTVNYAVAPVAPGAGTPTGNVTVTASTGETCTGTAAAGACTIIFNSAGPRTLTAVYAGDANFNGSTSAAAAHNVVLGTPPQNNLAKLFPDDPLLCAGAAINGAFGQTNSTAFPITGRVFVTLERLVATPGSVVCTLSPATGGATTFCNIENGMPTWRGTLAAGQRLDVTYQGQIPESVTTNACSTASSQFPDVTGAVLSAAQFCLSINCPGTAGPGVTPDARSIINDGKAGSVLIYNAYTSSATGANFAAATTTPNTRINITNTSTTAPVFVHLFFVDGSTCAVADSYLCLTANQTASFLASDLDPGTSGYLVAVAVDRTGCPIVFNHLIGDEYVKFASGHAANLAAEAIAAIPGGLTFCDPTSDTALLRFDGINYNAVPHVVAVDNIPSRLDGNDTLLILNRIGGSLVSGAAALGTVVGIFYDDAENALSFTFAAGTCQTRGSLSNSFPRIAPRFETFIPAGRSGWLKLYVPPLVGVSGAVINLSSNTNGFNQGHNLHKLTLTNAALITIPVFPPSC